MNVVIPSILAKTKEEFEVLVRKLEPHVERVHLDIIDGEFAENKTIEGYAELRDITTKLAFDVHLMVKKPDMEPWYTTKADRFIIHAESECDHLGLFTEMEQKEKRRAIAFNPETELEKFGSLIPHTDFVQFMTVNPGFYGSPFLPEMIDKIGEFHGKHPQVTIAVDGGITPETAAKVSSAGASILVCGSYIIQSSNISEAIATLQAL